MSECMCGVWRGGGGIGLMTECMCAVWEGGLVSCLSVWVGFGGGVSVFGAGAGGGHVPMGMQDLHLDNIK